MKKACKIIALLMTVLTVAVLAIGCAGSDAASTGSYYADSASYAKSAPAYAYATEAAYEEPAEYDYYDAPAAAMGEESGSGLNGLGEASYVENDRKLIYTSYYTIETKQFDRDYNAIIAAIDVSGGFLSSEDTYGTKPEAYGDAGRTARLTLRIPVGSYDTFLAAVEGVGNITQKSRSTEDVTTSYYDNEARIELYETHYDKLMEHLKNATDMKDIIAIESEMTDVLYTIDSLKGTKRHLDDRIAYCTVNINLNEVVEYTEIVVAKETFGERVKSSFMNVIKGLGRFLQGLAVFLISALPVVALIAAFFCAIFFPVRAISRKRKAKRALRAATKVQAETVKVPEAPKAE